MITKEILLHFEQNASSVCPEKKILNLSASLLDIKFVRQFDFFSNIPNWYYNFDQNCVSVKSNTSLEIISLWCFSSSTCFNNERIFKNVMLRVHLSTEKDSNGFNRFHVI